MDKQLNDDFVTSLLKGVFLHEALADVCVQHLKETYIADEDHQLLWKTFLKLHKRNGSYPSLPYLQQHLDATNSKKDDNGGALDLLGSFKGSVKSDVDVRDTLEALEDYVRQNMFVESYNDMGEAWNRGERDKAFELYKGMNDKLNNFSLKQRQLDRVFGDFDKRYAEREIESLYDNAIQIPYGLSVLNDDTGGGAWTGETELWIGDSGTGKSRLLVSLGMDTAKAGYNVLHVQAEGTKKQLKDNYDANFTKTLQQTLKVGNMSTGKFRAFSQKAHKYMEQNKGEVFLHAVEKFDAITMYEIRQVALDLIRSGITLHRIIIDYLELIGTGDGKSYDYQGAAQREQKQVARMMKNLAVETNTLVSTATQTHTISPEFLNNPNFVITRFNIGEAKRVIEPFSYVYSINQTMEERKLGRARVFADKFRDHASGQIYPVVQDLGKATFFKYKETLKLIEQMREEDEELEDDR